MKKRLVESLEVPKTSKRGWWTEVQLVENILVLNAFFNKGLRARHCINIDTKRVWDSKRGSMVSNQDPKSV